VLDLACGSGVVTRHAAQAVGSAGRVAGLDLGPKMLAEYHHHVHCVVSQSDTQ
jgi:ubiquinone/menaquinone biosynthesis C-methylase UbiE